MTTRSIDSAPRGRFARSVMVVAAIAAGHPAYAGPTRNVSRSMSYDDAVELLRVPSRWCAGAAALVRLGDRRAIRPLYRVVARTEEGLPDRGCVYNALETLGVHDEIVKLVASADVADRHTAIELMRACPADAHAPLLARLALHDPEPGLRRRAARTLRTQKVTADWDVAMIALLDASDSEIRELAATSLQHRFGATILAALRQRLKIEPQAAVRGTLEVAIHHQEDHAVARP
jgi:hypothetical protein